MTNIDISEPLQNIGDALNAKDAEIERLRAALEEIATHNPQTPEAAIARQALA